MTQDLDVVIPSLLDNVRIDRAISMVADVSRARASSLLEKGLIALDGKIVTSRKHILREGQALRIHLDDVSTQRLYPDPSVAFEVIYQDQDLIVVDKPAGLVVHPGSGQREGTLLAGLLARFPDLEGREDLGDLERPGIVHRLDKGTSGILAVARTKKAYDSLKDQLEVRTMKRRYVALVKGHIAEDRGVIDAPIGRSVRTPTRMAVLSSGKQARTNFLVLAKIRIQNLKDAHANGEGDQVDASVLSVNLETGRTHQIRVHLAAIGHPVVGDERYGLRREARKRSSQGKQDLEDDAVFSDHTTRVFLHAEALGLVHPSTTKRVEWHARLPQDFSHAIGIEGRTAVQKCIETSAYEGDF